MRPGGVKPAAPVFQLKPGNELGKIPPQTIVSAALGPPNCLRPVGILALDFVQG